MKKIVLSALLLAAVSVSASAEMFPGSNGIKYSGPNRGQLYSCDYTNYSGSAVDGGTSSWTLGSTLDATGLPLLRGTEYFDATLPSGGSFVEGYKATWAKPKNINDPHLGQYTQWEFTFNPYGPQCKKATVLFNGFKLLFGECSDGHTRTCTLVY